MVVLTHIPSKISVTKQTNSHVMQHCHAITMHGFVAFRFDSNRNIHVVFPRVENGSIFEYITMSTLPADLFGVMGHFT